MSRSILVYGESGSGKTTSARTLDPTTTFYIDADRKGLSWKGWKKQYNKDNRNYCKTSKVDEILNIFKCVNSSESYKHVQTVVVDGLTTVMVDDEMERMKEKSYDKFVDLAQCVWGLVATSHLLRDDVTVVFIAHCETMQDESGFIWTRTKTSGKKLNKIVLESKFSTVLWAKALDGRYVFETQANHSTAKSPMGCFEKIIDNDINFVIDKLKAYEEE